MIANAFGLEKMLEFSSAVLPLSSSVGSLGTNGTGFSGWMPFLSPNQQYLSTEETAVVQNAANVVCCQETTQLQKKLRLNQGSSDDGTPANCVDDEQFQQFVKSARSVMFFAPVNIVKYNMRVKLGPDLQKKNRSLYVQYTHP